MPRTKARTLSAIRLDSDGASEVLLKCDSKGVWRLGKCTVHALDTLGDFEVFSDVDAATPFHACSDADLPPPLNSRVLPELTVWRHRTDSEFNMERWRACIEELSQNAQMRSDVSVQHIRSAALTYKEDQVVDAFDDVATSSEEELSDDSGYESAKNEGTDDNEEDGEEDAFDVGGI